MKHGKTRSAAAKNPAHAPRSDAPGTPPVTEALPWVHLLIVAVLAVAVFSNTLFMDFVWDDIHQVKGNQQIRSLSNIPEFFTTHVWAGVRGFSSSYYRPLFNLSLALDYAVWGLSPIGYHLTNVILHALVSCLLLLLLRKLTGDALVSLLSAALFAVHPGHAEAVAWISARNEMICALFVFGSLYLYKHFTETGKTVHLALSIGLFFMALLAKETAAVLPLIILAMGVSGEKPLVTKRILHAMSYAAGLVPYLVLRLTAVEALSTGDATPLLARLFTMPSLVVYYFGLLLFPFVLKVYYDVAVKQAFTADVLLPLFGLGLVAFVIVRARRYDWRVSFGLLFALITLLPVSGILGLLGPSLMADRYLYMPSAGFLLAAVSLGASLALGNAPVPGIGAEGLKDLLRGRARSITLVVSTLVLILGVTTVIRNFAWKDPLTFMHRMVADAPANPFAHYSLGATLDDAGKLEEAARSFERSLEISPAYVDSINNLATVYDRLGRPDKALQLYKAALDLTPENVKVHNNFALLLEQAGRPEEAIRIYQRALSLQPSNMVSMTNLGILFRKLGRYDEAAKVLADALKFDANDASLHNELGVVRLLGGQLPEAVKSFGEAVRLKPAYPEAFNNMGIAYRRLGRAEEAERAFYSAIQVNPNYAEALNNLGILYASQGRVSEAVSRFETAARLDPQKEAYRANLQRAREQLKKKGS